MQDLFTEVLKQQQDARNAGFDWDNAEQVLEKLYEETAELKVAMAQGGREQIIDEFGDVLLTIINLSRHLDINLEQSLCGSLTKFSKRYQQMLKIAEQKNLVFTELSLLEKEDLWHQAKIEISKNRDDS